MDREDGIRDPLDRTYKATSGTHKPEHTRESDIGAPIVRSYMTAMVKTADAAKKVHHTHVALTEKLRCRTQQAQA